MNGARTIFDSIGKLSLNEENLGSSDCISNRLACSGDMCTSTSKAASASSSPTRVDAKIIDLAQLVEAKSPVDSVQISAGDDLDSHKPAALSTTMDTTAAFGDPSRLKEALESPLINGQPTLQGSLALKRQSKGLVSNLYQLSAQHADKLNLTLSKISNVSTQSVALTPEARPPQLVVDQSKLPVQFPSPSSRTKSSSSTNETFPVADQSPLKKFNYDNDKKIKKATQGLNQSLESKNLPLKDNLESLVEPTKTADSTPSKHNNHNHHQHLNHHHNSSNSNHLNHHHYHDKHDTSEASKSESSSSASAKSHGFNIENELIKYTKTLKLNSQSFMEHYKLGAHIRNGGFSEIYEGTHLKTSDRVIIKLIPKRKTKNWLLVHNKKYPAEVLLHKMCNHVPGVVKMLEFFEQEHEWIIIMPKILNCMDLFDYLESKHRGRLDESEARHFFTQLVRINIDLFNMGVVHRDIKSENILVDLSNMNLILIDFGASAICKNTLWVQSSLNQMNPGAHFFTDFHGTRQYKPPEYIATKKYSALPSTAWTLGILLYDMCNGQLPFETEQEIIEYNLQIKTNVSNEYKKLLFDCLHKDPRLRPSLVQILDYAWCKNGALAATLPHPVTPSKSTALPTPISSPAAATVPQHAPAPSPHPVSGSKKTTEV